MTSAGTVRLSEDKWAYVAVVIDGGDSLERCLTITFDPGGYLV